MRRNEAGFSLAEVMVVSAITMLTVGVAAPTITSGLRAYSLNTAAQTVASTVRSARFQAVTKNRTFRVRFNCPAANQMRVVEVVNNPAIDNAADRCSLNSYPYPDPNPAVLPNGDGPGTDHVERDARRAERFAGQPTGSDVTACGMSRMCHVRPARDTGGGRQLSRKAHFGGLQRPGLLVHNELRPCRGLTREHRARPGSRSSS